MKRPLPPYEALVQAAGRFVGLHNARRAAELAAKKKPGLEPTAAAARVAEHAALKALIAASSVVGAVLDQREIDPGVQPSPEDR